MGVFYMCLNLLLVMVEVVMIMVIGKKVNYNRYLLLCGEGVVFVFFLSVVWIDFNFI